MKKSSTLVFILLAAAGIIVAAGTYYTFQKNSSEPTPTTAKSLKTFKSSETMDFTIELPVEYEVEERFGSATINTKNGSIKVGLYGTNYDNLRDHMLNLNELNKYDVIDSNFLEISGHESLVQQIKWLSGILKEYVIYIEGNVYSFSTEQPELYDDLDQIARSFRYTPN